MVEISRWPVQQGQAALDLPTDTFRKKILKDVAEALESNEITPQELFYTNELSKAEKLVLALGAMPEYLQMHFIEHTVDLIQTVYAAPSHTFGYKVQKDIMAVLAAIKRYAREEITTRQLEEYLYENGIIKSRPAEIDPDSVVKVVVTLYRTITELNAHHDVDYYSETDSREAYLDDVTDRSAEMLYFLVESTYKDALH
jgi:predicted glycoside hydrolase/deacetylase ChbG (UPF0249 family)